jgi:hypothetical protein
VRDVLRQVDLVRKRLLPASANEQPAGQSRSITAAIAWPWPMHIVATP